MTNQLSILVAEDEETDAFLLKHAVKKAGLPHQVVVALDGREAVDYLSGQPPFTDREQHPLPALVLLDLKMPRMSGFDVLAWLQNQPHFKELPAVVLTSSADEADRKRAQELGAADYRVKPNDLHGLVKVIHDLRTRWLDPRS